MLLQKGWFKKKLQDGGFRVWDFRVKDFFRVLGLGFRVFGFIIGFSG